MNYLDQIRQLIADADEDQRNNLVVKIQSVLAEHEAELKAAIAERQILVQGLVTKAFVHIKLDLGHVFVDHAEKGYTIQQLTIYFDLGTDQPDVVTKLYQCKTAQEMFNVLCNLGQ